MWPISDRSFDRSARRPLALLRPTPGPSDSSAYPPPRGLTHGPTGNCNRRVAIDVVSMPDRIPEHSMTPGRETARAATDAARAAVAYLDEEARWALLQKWLEKESADQREGGRRSLRLEALRSIVSPYVSDGDWDEVVREHWPVRWADQLRLANALACVRRDAAREGRRARHARPADTPAVLTRGGEDHGHHPVHPAKV